MQDPEQIKQRQARLEQMVADLLSEARRQGASAAEAGVNSDVGLSVDVRMGEVETIEHTRDNGLGVTVYFGQRKGTASTSDFSRAAIEETVRAACNIARHTNEDPCSGLADAELMAKDWPDLDLYHPWAVTPAEAVEQALRCEAAARAVDPRITNTDGASFNSHESLQVYGNSHGFVGGYPTSRHSLSCAVVGSQDGSMQRDYWYSSDRLPERLDSPEAVGRKAGERTVARLGARRLSTREAPVLFEPEMAVNLLRCLVGAVRGSALYRRSSFLLDHLGQRILPEFVRISEDPHQPRGIGSTPFDGEGVATHPRDLVSEGVLQGYVLSSYSARKLGMQTTGNSGGVHNLHIQPTDHRGLDELIREMGTGLVITEMMGHGINIVTGDYSRGAAGYWVENGEIQYPVEEITVAGNLRDMFLGLQAVGNDDQRPGNIRTGSWLIDRMTIAGE